MEFLSKEEWLKKRKKKRQITAGIIFGTAAVLLILLFVLLIQAIIGLLTEEAPTGEGGQASARTTEVSQVDEPDEAGSHLLDGVTIEEMFLTPNEYSRPQTPLEEVTGIAIHYVGNPGTTALNNRNYFNSLAESRETSASSHYVIGLEGEIIQCIPLDEISYATRQANYYTISIECCHPDESGEFNEATYESLVKLTAWLCDQYGLDRDGIIRHYDVTGKECPLYYVRHEDAWEQFKDDVMNYLEEGKAAA